MNDKQEKFTMMVLMDSGKIAGRSRDAAKEVFEALLDGWWKLSGEKRMTGYEKPSRYKYYFSGLLPSIFPVFRTRYSCVIHSTGETYFPETILQLHQHVRGEYMRVQSISEEGVITDKAVSTTVLSDYDFINIFLQKIIQDASEEGIEVETYEDWAVRYELKRIWKLGDSSFMGKLKKAIKEKSKTKILKEFKISELLYSAILEDRIEFINRFN